MARMLRAHASRWQRATPTYTYEIKGNLRAREKRAWQRDAYLLSRLLSRHSGQRHPAQ